MTVRSNLSKPSPTREGFRISNAERIAVALVLLASFVLFNVYSAVTPLFEASDELWHYPMVMRLATGGGLPIQRKDQTDADAPWRQEGSQPPLYYWIAAFVSSSFDHSNWRELRRINPHADMGVPTHDGNANAMLHTSAEAFPWRRAALAAHIARFVSIVMSTLTVFFSYRAASVLFVDDKRQMTTERIATMIFVAFVPMFAFISGSVNNDNAAMMFSTIGLWWALRMIRLGDASLKSAVIAGAISGLGALSKSSVIGLVGLFGVAAVFSRIQKSGVRIEPPQLSALGSSLTALGAWLLVLCSVFALIAGWWFARNLNLYGDLLGWNAFLDVVGRRDQPATLAQLWTEREGFVWSYWGVFGTMNVILSPVIYVVLNAIVIASLFGVGYWLFLTFKPSNFQTRHFLLSTFHLQLIACAVWIALIFIALLRWTSLTPASQGRLMFPAIAAIAALIALGLGSIHRFVLWAGCAILIGVAWLAPFMSIAPTYQRPPDGWASPLTEKINVVFADSLQLVEGQNSFEDGSLVERGERVTLNLNWKLLKPLPKNYSVFVHLIDASDVIVAQRDMHPGQGNIALSEVSAPYAWTDRYTVRVPLLTPTNKTYRWAVGVYDFESGERLKLSNGDDRVIFGRVDIAPHHVQIKRDVLLVFDNGIKLSDYALDSESLSPNKTLSVKMRWKVDQPIDADYTLSLQLLDDKANKIAQQDLGQPTSTWAKGIVETQHELQIGIDAPPNVYRLLLVWYRPSDFKRIAAYEDRGQFVGDQIELTKLRLK